MRSLQTRLLVLWLLLAASACVTAFLLLEFYQQSASAQVSREEDVVTRACRDIGDRYAFFAAGWTGADTAGIDATLKRQLADVVVAALSRAAGVEGGIWQASSGSIAYAYPTYEGSGPKTDCRPPNSPLSGKSMLTRCAVTGPSPCAKPANHRFSLCTLVHLPVPCGDDGMDHDARVYRPGRAYNQLLLGLAVLGVTVFGSALWLGYILLRWSRSLGRLRSALTNRDRFGDLPALPATGEHELDRLVEALNTVGARVAEERRRAAAAERLAATGRLAAGLAHEIRNPIAAMRLKAENALAGADDSRRISALQSILDQVGRVDALLRNLLAMTQQNQVKHENANVAQFLAGIVESHRELAQAKGVRLEVGTLPDSGASPQFDVDQMRRALDNLVLNGIQNTASGGDVTLDAIAQNDTLRVRVSNTGAGIPDSIRTQLFEPFVTTRADGTGLGLAVVREIARAHGGEARLVPSAAGRFRDRGAMATVLIVDDDGALREGLAETLAISVMCRASRFRPRGPICRNEIDACCSIFACPAVWTASNFFVASAKETMRRRSSY